MYTLYAPIHPQNRQLCSVVIRQNVDRRFKQHREHASSLTVWMCSFLQQGRPPLLHLLEDPIPDLKAVRERETSWRECSTRQGHPLAHMQGNVQALCERAEQAVLAVRRRSRTAHLPRQEATQLPLCGYDRYGYDASDMAYDLIRTAGKAMDKLPGINGRMSERGLATYIFHVYDTPIPNFASGSEENL